MPIPRFFFQFWILNKRILVQTESFLYSLPKAGLNAVPTVKITLGTPFPGVPAAGRWKRSQDRYCTARLGGQVCPREVWLHVQTVSCDDGRLVGGE